MKKRIDVMLVASGYATGRERAKELISQGQVYVNGTMITKPSLEVASEDSIHIKGDLLKYVSRGGLKLEKAISTFSLTLEGCICCDFGASTGGFTDCMLQNGARKVYAVDVGTGQLAEKLQRDPRVINQEQTNIRYLSSQEIPEEIDFISVDVSFISLKHILPVASSLLSQSGTCVCLVKPQFEAGKEKIGKKGVVKDSRTHLAVLQNTVAFAMEHGFAVKSLTYSPVQGPEGNIEYLMHLQKVGETCVGTEEIQNVVTQSQNAFKSLR